MYHDLVFSTCHRVNVGGTVSHVFLSRKRPTANSNLFFSGKLTEVILLTSKASRGPLCQTSTEGTSLSKSQVMHALHVDPYTVQDPSKTGLFYKFFFFRPPPWIKGWNLTLAVFSSNCQANRIKSYFRDGLVRIVGWLEQRARSTKKRNKN